MSGLDGGMTMVTVSVLGLSWGSGSREAVPTSRQSKPSRIGAVVFAVGETFGRGPMTVSFSRVETYLSPNAVSRYAGQAAEAQEQELLGVCAHRLWRMSGPVIMVPAAARGSFEFFRQRCSYAGSGLRWQSAASPMLRPGAVRHCLLPNVQTGSDQSGLIDDACPFARAECLALQSWVRSIDHLERTGRLSPRAHGRAMDTLYEVLLSEQGKRPHWAAWLQPQ